MDIEDLLNVKFNSPQQKAMINLKYTCQYIGQRQNVYMDKYGLTLAQFNILRILRGAKIPLNINTIKERMIEKSPNTTRLMDKLIIKNLIEKVRCEEDKRVVYVKINQFGLDLLLQIDETIDETLSNFNRLTDEEATLLCNILDKLRDK